jgi:uncharacterized SAM-binding protein YcdF (DUF218 family)
LLDPIWLKSLLKALILPPTGLLLLAALGLGLQRRFPRTGRAFAVAGVLLLLMLSMPVVATFLLRAVDSSPPLDLERAKTAQAIVILGGGTRHNAAEYGGDTLGRLTLERVRYGAHVARLTGLPILVTGGSPFGGESEAKLMQQALEHEFGITVRWAEDRSRNTHENAARSAEILHKDGIHRVVLVGHGFDMPRATAEFTDEGIETIKAPTEIPAWDFDLPRMFVPSIGGLEGSHYALYEILANLVRSLAHWRISAGKAHELSTCFTCENHGAS